MVTSHFLEPSAASGEKIRGVIACGRTPVIQFGEAPDPAQLEQVNDYCREFGAELQVRFFGQRWREFDTATLRYLPDAATLQSTPCVRFPILRPLQDCQN